MMRFWMGFIAIGCMAMAAGTPDAIAQAESSEEADVTVAATEEVAVMITTEGLMVARFFPDVAPGHVENFQKLSREDFYDGTKFHRVIEGFMIQGGDPNTKDQPPSTWGTGSPGYTIDAEFNEIQHEPGILSMARSRNPDSAGSQFFVMHGKAPSLDGQYTVFGQLVDGMDVLDAIATAPVKPNRMGERSMPVEPVTLKKVELMTWEAYQEAKEDLQAQVNEEKEAGE